MLLETHLADDKLFNSVVESLKELTYQDILALPVREKLIIPNLSKYTTIEVTTHFYEIDSAILVTATQFVWLPKSEKPSFLSSMHSIELPLSNSDDSLIYSGHCKTEFFYALEENIMTDDIFLRNDLAENKVQETCQWFGKTGLKDKEERLLSKYIRCEYGELLLDKDGLKASDLTFLGQFKSNNKLIEHLQLDLDVKPKDIYAWHYRDNHYAYAYRNTKGVLQYEIGNQSPLY